MAQKSNLTIEVLSIIGGVPVSYTHLELTRKVTHLGSQLGRLLPDKTGFPLQVLIKYNHTFPHHQSIFCSAETKNVNSTVYSQLFERKMKGGTGIGNPCSVHVDIHTVQMGKVSQTFQFFGCINRSEFGALRDVKRTGLRMMLVAEAVQIRLCLLYTSIDSQYLFMRLSSITK